MKPAELPADPATPTREPIWRNRANWPKPCPHGILLGMMVCPACEPEKQAEAEEAARRHAAQSQVGWTDPAPATPCRCGRPACEGCDKLEAADCDRTGNCPARNGYHALDCLALTLTDAELETGVVPPDDELRARRDITPATPTGPRNAIARDAVLAVLAAARAGRCPRQRLRGDSP